MSDQEKLTDEIAELAGARDLTEAGALDRLQSEISKLPQYEPITENFFHGGMYCRKVTRHAGTVTVGAVHKKEHFYLLVSGEISINGGPVIKAPAMVTSGPGTKRAIAAVTDAICLTFHRTDATNVEDAERDLIEIDPASMFGPGNKLKQEVLP